MDKLKLHTPDFTQENILKLGELFPNCVTEIRAEDGTLRWGIDFDQLRQELSDHVVDGPRERYHLNWPGKREAMLTANAPIAKTLRPSMEESVNFNTTRNLFIEGDNLDALKLLQESYLGKVKFIYIDPPYNIGDDYVYSDDFVENAHEYLLKSLQRDDESRRLVMNSESAGRYHSTWLTMISSRLRLARNLLSSDGVIVISIDDVEVANVRRVCDEVFGEHNFVATLVWEKGRKNDARRFSVGHDYLLVYARDLDTIEEICSPWRESKAGIEEISEEYKRLKSQFGHAYSEISEGLVGFYASLPKDHPSKKYSRSRFVDKRGIWRDNNISWPGGGGPKYDLPHPGTGLPCKVPDDGWRFVEATMKSRIDAGYVEFRADHTSSPFLKSYLYVDPESDDRSSVDESGDKKQVMGSVFYRHTQPSNDVIKGLFGEKVFNNPKDHMILMRLIRYLAGPDDIVMDFFAGSSSFAHACLEANLQDGGRRTFIMVQLDEQLLETKKEHKLAISFCEEQRLPTNVAEISKERIRRAGSKIKEGAGLQCLDFDIGFRVLKIDTSNMKDVFYTPDTLRKDDLFDHIENIKGDRKPVDLLFQVLLDWGVDLRLPISQEHLDGKTVFFVDENALVACFDTGVTEELVKKLAARKPIRAVFRDAGFSSDSVKINVEQIFKLISPGTEVKAI